MISLSVLILKQGELSSVLEPNTVSPRCAELVTSLTCQRGWVGRPETDEMWPISASFLAPPSSPLLFLDLLGIKQRELGLRPTHLLSVTLLILVAMQFSFLSIFSVAKLVMYEEQLLL